MFPTFKTGISQQAPSNTLIQQFIDDVGGDIDAILQRRFGEIIQQTYAGNFANFQASFSTDAQNILEKINRYGAAAGLGRSLATMGAAAAERLGRDFGDEYDRLSEELYRGGLYDYLFDPESRIISPRPALEGIAGGDMQRGETPREEGLSDYFGKFEKF
jgi:plasmid stabilization system protein ParE